MNIRFFVISASAVFALGFQAQASQDRAHADMMGKSNSTVTGTVDFKDTARGLQVHYDLKGLNPGQTHGFHIHEKGDCSSDDAKSAGGHYMKIADKGGTSLQTPEKYAGDLKSIVADKDGNAQGTIYAKDVTVDGKNPIVDHAIIIHGGPDDVTKKSPPRIACGKIVKN